MASKAEQLKSHDKIPNLYYFVWYGSSFQLTHYLAIKSVAVTCNPFKIYLYISEPLDSQIYFQKLTGEVDCLEIIFIDIKNLIKESGYTKAEKLIESYNYLYQNRYFAALSDLLRYLFLIKDGGVYMDLDILTIKDLTPLLKKDLFCGTEHILVSGAVSNSLLRYFRTVPLTILRSTLAHLSSGVQIFKKISWMYLEEINGAILGAPPSHPVLIEALDNVCTLSVQIPKRRTVIGPDLLQKLLRDNKFSNIKIYNPDYFYPIGPTMAINYFKFNSKLDKLEKNIISTDTYVLHWYSDGTNKYNLPATIDDLHINAPNQLYARLALKLLYI